MSYRVEHSKINFIFPHSHILSSIYLLVYIMPNSALHVRYKLTLPTISTLCKRLIVTIYQFFILFKISLQRTLRDLKIKREQWIKSEPWLPHLDDETINEKKMKSYITDCVKIAWRMVNLLPPLKIVLTNQVSGRELDEFFEIEKEEAKENTPTITVSVLPALTDDVGRLVEKGKAVIIPDPKRQQECVV